jgi:hypothetical protein
VKLLWKVHEENLVKISSVIDARTRSAQVSNSETWATGDESESPWQKKVVQ